MRYEKIISQNNKIKIKGKKIVGIYQFEEAPDDADYNDLEESMIIELETGYLISEIRMAPISTAAAGICIFKSKKELVKGYGQKLIKVY